MSEVLTITHGSACFSHLLRSSSSNESDNKKSKKKILSILLVIEHKFLSGKFGLK